MLTLIVGLPSALLIGNILWDCVDGSGVYDPYDPSALQPTRAQKLIAKLRGR